MPWWKSAILAAVCAILKVESPQEAYQRGWNEREAKAKEAVDDAKARSDAAIADLGDGLHGLDTDPDNRDRQ